MDVGQKAHSCCGKEEDGRVLYLIIGDIFEGMVDELLKVVGSNSFWLLSECRDTYSIASVTVPVRDTYGNNTPG